MSWKLYYDGGCNLCHDAKLRAEKWADQRHLPLEVGLLQGSEAVSKGYLDQMVLEADGEVLFGSRAWLRLMRLAPWYLRWISWLDRFRMTRWLANRFYELVRQNRYKWFGRRACSIPNSPSKQASHKAP